MAFQKINDSEAMSGDGNRIKLGGSVLSYIQGSRYLTVPIEAAGSELRIHLSHTSRWMEYGQPIETEGTQNITFLRLQITEALKVLGLSFSFY